MRLSKLSKLSESFELSESLESSKKSLSGLSKIYLNSLKTPIDQIWNKINDSNSKYFESSQTSTSTSANITDATRIFSENSTQISSTNELN